MHTLHALDPFSIGFEDIFSHFRKLQEPGKALRNAITYPPYNIKKVNDRTYVVELAVAGFAKEDITIELEDNTLKISGKTIDDEEREYVYKGIAAREFVRTFTLADHLVVSGADLVNGMLRIWLDAILPERKVKQIAISNSAPSYGYLTEASDDNPSEMEPEKVEK